MISSAQGDGSRPAFTDEQEQPVARRSEALLLSAAAGSGKTSVLVERFVRAVREDEIAPARILAITFTDRAAGELRERVRARLLELGEREAARDTDAAFVSTFHGFCARLLRTHPLPAGLDPDFTILDEGRAGRLRLRAFTLALRGFLEGEREQAVELLAAYRIDRVRPMIEGVHARLRSQGQLLARLPSPVLADDAGALEREAAAACELLDELLLRFGSSYEQLKQERSAVDFDDLELRAWLLLDERASVRREWAERFELLMVDEFQDTNPRQLAILRALERENLFTVGDEHQSIYGFRDADVSLFRARREQLAAQGASLALTRNFRSRAPLLDVVNAVFAERLAGFIPLVAARGAERSEAAELQAAVAQPMLWDRPQEPTAPADPPLVELLLSARGGWEESPELAQAISRGLPPGTLWRQAEARLLAQRVAELVADGQARAGEVAVLLRAGGDLEIYERALQLCGLRTLAASGGFWAHQQIADLLAYLRVLANPLDELALYSVLASPLVGLTRDALALLARAAHDAGRGVWETACEPASRELLGELSERDGQALGEFCARLAVERAAAPRRTIAELLQRAIAASGYREHVLTLDWGERRLANVHKLLRLARRFEVGEGRDLRGFLDHVEHLQDPANSRESDAPVEGVEPDAVRLMSIHAAKGLEFPVVCVADLGRTPYTTTPDLLVDGERIGLRLARLDGEKATATLQYAELAEELRQAEAAEEDRILYVAMTRARERLLLSGGVDFERWPPPRQAPTMISWLAPALAQELPELARTLESPSHDLRVGAHSTRVRCLLSAPSTVGAVLRLGADVPPPQAPAPQQPQPLSSAAASSAPPQRAAAETSPLDSATTLSYSSLAELERCGYRYYLERVLGLPEDRAAARSPAGARTLEARARGTLVHALLERLDFGRPSAPSAELVGAVARELGIRAGRQECAEIAATIAQALPTETAARVAEAHSIRRERPFAFALEPAQQPIVGVIDLLAENRDGTILVLDYKSDRVAAGEDLEALVERDYAIQRLIYALAVLREGVAHVEIVHWFLERPHEPVHAGYAASERESLERELQARLARARERGFAVSPHPHRGLCLSCPGRAGLCSWEESRTLREHPTTDPAVAETSL
jgi:ATP-dependent exoDNAse (exonuclease V) beta subunit